MTAHCRHRSNAHSSYKRQGKKPSSDRTRKFQFMQAPAGSTRRAARRARCSNAKHPFTNHSSHRLYDFVPGSFSCKELSEASVNSLCSLTTNTLCTDRHSLHWMCFAIRSQCRCYVVTWLDIKSINIVNSTKTLQH